MVLKNQYPIECCELEEHTEGIQHVMNLVIKTFQNWIRNLKWT